MADNRATSGGSMTEQQKPTESKPTALDYATPVAKREPQRPPLVTFMLVVAILAIAHGVVCELCAHATVGMFSEQFRAIRLFLESPRLRLPNTVGDSYSRYLIALYATSLFWGFLLTSVIYAFRWVLKRSRGQHE
jgi:hypothetical protein